LVKRSPTTRGKTQTLPALRKTEKDEGRSMNGVRNGNPGKGEKTRQGLDPDSNKKPCRSECWLEKVKRAAGRRLP